MRAIVIILGLLFALPALAQTADDVSAAIDSMFGDHTEFEAAFYGIQGAVAEGDAEAVANWVAYPIEVTTQDGDRLTLADEAEFVAHYAEFMSDDIVNAVATQDYADLFVNSEGVMFGSGEVWLSGVCQDDACNGFDVRIITIQSTTD